MILHNITIYNQSGLKHIHISNGIIKQITDNREAFDHLTDELRIELNGLFAYPGFINSHDHLDFNLFPGLGNRVYPNYTEWGKDIHARHADLIKAVQKVPKHLRVQWGLYKNLLNGFTTVVNHGEKLAVDNKVVDLFQDCDTLHSPAFEKGWKRKLNKLFNRKRLVVMHVGEGTDRLSEDEIASVLNWNLFKRKIVAVHGVAMNVRHAGDFAGLVWCPASNYFLLNQTAAVHELREKTTVVFGTDSTLTAPWAIQKHLAIALETGKVTHDELLAMLTTSPAKLWGFNDRGVIQEGRKADILLAGFFDKICEEDDQQMVMVIEGGEVKMISTDIFKGTALSATDYDEIILNNRNMMVKTGLKNLVTEIHSYYPEANIPFRITENV